MVRRLRLSLVLCAALLWLTIDVVCGATWRFRAAGETCAAPAPAKNCCASDDSAPVKPACPADACGLTCATMLIAQVNEEPFELCPRVSAQPVATADLYGVVMREPPPVPPPRRVLV